MINSANKINYTSVSPELEIDSTIFPFNLTVNFFSHLLNNITSHTNMIISPNGKISLPGAMVASPSYPVNSPNTDQNYIYDWTRDSALVITELSKHIVNYANLKTYMINYYNFVKITQNNSVHLDQAKWYIDGTPVPNIGDNNPNDRNEWTLQGDGPALRIIALISIFDYIKNEINNNDFYNVVDRYLNWILENYDNHTYNIWEESYGQHFYVYAVIYKALTMINQDKRFNRREKEVSETLNKLLQKKQEFFRNDHFKSSISSDIARGNDINIDTIFGLYIADGYGDPFTEYKSLENLAVIIRYFRSAYLINNYDNFNNYGVNCGRYPLDTYDGDIATEPNEGHPWFISTLIVGSYLYRIAYEVRSDNNIQKVLTAKNFSDLVGINTNDSVDSAIHKIIDSGNKQIQSAKFHCGNYHMSEQYDRYSGYMKSVEDLSWSYKEYFTALREMEKLLI